MSALGAWTCLATAIFSVLLNSGALVEGQQRFTLAVLFPKLDEPMWLTAEAAVHLAVHHINNRNFSVVGEELEAAIHPSLELRLVSYSGLAVDAPDMARHAAESVYKAHTLDGAVAVVGPYTSREALQAASVSSVLQVPMVTFSTSSTELSNRKEYPYFMRTNPDAADDAVAMLSVVARYGWRDFGLVFTDDAYGINMNVEVQEEASRLQLRLHSFALPIGDAEGAQALVDAMGSSGVRIFVSAVYGDDLPVVLGKANAAGIMGPGFVWMCIQADASLVLNDTLSSPEAVDVIRPNMQGVLWLRNEMIGAEGTGTTSSAFQRHQLALRQTPASTYASADLAARLATSTPLPLEWSAYSYDAVWTLAVSLSRTIVAEAGGSAPESLEFRQQLRSQLQFVEFQGASGLVAFTETGNRQPEHIGNSLYFLDVQPGAPRTGQWVPSLTFVGSAPVVVPGQPDAPGVVPVVWASGSIEIPAGGTACRQGLTFDWRTNRCVYLVNYVAAFTSTISMRNVLAAQVAVRHVNERNASVVPDAAMLPPGFKMKLEMYDTRFSPAGGVEGGLEAYNSGAIGVIGAARSSACVPLSHVLLASQTPVVSFACTSESLSSEESFPYFSRTIPTDAELVKLMARTMLSGFGWRRIGVLFQEDDYGFGVYQEFQNAARQVADDDGANAATDLQIGGAPLSPGLMRQSLQEMKDLGFRVFVVIVISFEDEFVRELQALEMFGMGYTYVTPDFRFDRVKEMDAEVVSRLLQGMLRMSWNPVIEPQYSAMVGAFVETPASDLDPLLAEKLQAADFDLEEWIAESVGGRDFPFAVYTYDAVWALALALARSEEEVEGWLEGDCGLHINCHGKELVQQIRGQSFRGASGMVKFNREENSDGETVFNANRDGSGISFPVSWPTHIEYWNSSLSAWVAVGQYEEDENGLGGLNLHSTLVWPGFVTVKPEDGSGCPASLYYNSSTTQCEPCGDGSFSAVRGSTSCKQCPRGQFCGKPNCVSCDSCTVDQYQDEEGQSQCEICPPNTVAQTRGSVTVESCLCKEGYYRRDRLPGRECFMCPAGGVCLGGTAKPYPANGYWGDWSLVDLDVPDSEIARKAIHYTLFHECRIREHCSSSCTDEPSALQGNISSPVTLPEYLVESHPCRSELANQCPKGREGRVCSSCKSGFFLLSDKCMTCQKPEILFVGGTVLCIIVFWYIINRVVASKYEAVDLMLIYLQNASTITAFNLNWDPALVNYAFWVLAIVNFDVTFISPQCTWSSWGYGHGLFLQLLLPIMVASIFAALYLINRLLLKLLLRTGNVAKSSISAFGVQSDTKVIGWAGVLMDRLGFVRSMAELSDLGDTYIAGSANFLNVVYHTLTLKSLETLFCSRLPDGSRYLLAGPEVMCWTKAHAGLLVGSIIGLLVYTIGIPLFFFMILRYGRTYNLFRNERFMRQWGWLYLRYEKEWYFWEVIIMIRRGLLVTVLVTCQQVPSLQLVVGIALVTALITSHFFARPFISTSLDLLDTFSLVSLMGLLCTGILFYDQYGAETFPSWRLVVTVICHVQLLGCMVMVAVMVYHDVKYEESLKSMTRKLRRMVAFAVRDGVWSDTGEATQDGAGDGGLEGAPVMSRRSSIVEAFGRLNSSLGVKFGTNAGTSTGDGTGGVSHKQLQLAKILSRESMELTKTLDEAALTKWLEKLQTMGEDSDYNFFASTKLAKVGRAATKMLLGSPDAEQGREGTELREGVVRFWLCNHWTKDVLSDTSPLSYYSQHQYALFFGNLVADNPYLLDYLLRATPEQRDVAKEVFAEMRDSQVNFSKDGQLATLVSDIDKGPLLAWILLADEEAISILRELLVSIYDAGKGEEDAIEADTTATPSPLLKPFDWLIKNKLPKPERLGLQAARRKQAMPAISVGVDAQESDAEVEQRALLEVGQREAVGDGAQGRRQRRSSTDVTVIQSAAEGEGTELRSSGEEERERERGEEYELPGQPEDEEAGRSGKDVAGRGVAWGPAGRDEGGKGAGRAALGGQPSRRKRRKLERTTSFTGLTLMQFDAEVLELGNRDTELGRALLQMERKLN